MEHQLESNPSRRILRFEKVTFTFFGQLCHDYISLFFAMRKIANILPTNRKNTKTSCTKFEKHPRSDNREWLGLKELSHGIWSYFWHVQMLTFEGNLKIAVY